MIGTFAAVLIFTMFKELFEDSTRMKEDRKVNNKLTSKFNYEKEEFEDVKWKNVRPGDILKINKDEEFPADLLYMYSQNTKGASEDIIFVDTMNLDGETNLKPRVISSEDFNKEGLHGFRGKVECDAPHESLEEWDGNLFVGDDES